MPVEGRMTELPPFRPPIITVTAEYNGQLIRAEVYGNPESGSLVIHDQQCQLITWNMGRFPALLAALTDVGKQIEARKEAS